MTPEGRTKSAVKDYLNSIGCIPASKAPEVKNHVGYYFMPVSNGMGVHGIPDIVGHYRGFFFAIETKTVGKDPTALQSHQLKAIEVSGGANFVVRGEGDLQELKDWVRGVNIACHKGERGRKV